MGKAINKSITIGQDIGVSAQLIGYIESLENITLGNLCKHLGIRFMVKGGKKFCNDCDSRIK